MADNLGYANDDTQPGEQTKPDKENSSSFEIPLENVDEVQAEGLPPIAFAGLVIINVELRRYFFHIFRYNSA